VYAFDRPGDRGWSRGLAGEEHRKSRAAVVVAAIDLQFAADLLGECRDQIHSQAAAGCGIEAFQTKRQAAFDAEREAWARRSESVSNLSLPEAVPIPDATVIPQGAELIEAPLGGNVWRIKVRQGDRVEKGTVIAAIEAMKTECEVPSPATGIVRAVYVQERQPITPGTPIIALEPLQQ